MKRGRAHSRSAPSKITLGYSATSTGRAELVKLQSAPRALRVRHWHASPVLTDKGDYLESVVYGMVVDISQDPPVIMAHFTYTDELVKLPDGRWRMRSRASARDLLRG